MNPLEAQSPELKPLSESTYFILLSLVPQPRHGYGIMKEVVMLSDGRTHLSTGTLYGALSRLLDRGWIERIDANHDQEAQRLQKVYRLTSRGNAVLNSEIDRLKRLVAAAQLQIGKESI